MTASVTTLVPLTQGKFAVIDSIDAERVLKFNWCAYFNPHNRNWYAKRKVRIDGKQVSIYLHRFILNAPPDKQVDHKDRDGLNDRRYNLRLADNSQNHQNMAMPSDNRSGFKGVSRQNSISPRWVARLVHRGTRHHFGTFGSPEDAARAYDAGALRIFGEFARLNFPEETI